MKKIILLLTFTVFLGQPGMVIGQAAEGVRLLQDGVNEYQISFSKTAVAEVLKLPENVLAQKFRDEYKRLENRLSNVEVSTTFVNKDSLGDDERHASDLYLIYDAAIGNSTFGVPFTNAIWTKFQEAVFTYDAKAASPADTKQLIKDNAVAVMTKMLKDILGTADAFNAELTDGKVSLSDWEAYQDFIDRFKVALKDNEVDKSTDLGPALDRLRDSYMPPDKKPVTPPTPQQAAIAAQNAATAQANAAGKLTGAQANTLVTLMNDPAFTTQLATYPEAAKKNLDDFKAKLAATTVQVSEEINNNLYLHDLMVTFYVVTKSAIQNDDKNKLGAILPIIFSVIPNGISPEAFPDFLMKGVNRLYGAPPSAHSSCKGRDAG